MLNIKFKIPLLIVCIVSAFLGLWYMGYSERRANKRVAENINHMSSIELDYIILAPTYLSREKWQVTGRDKVDLDKFRKAMVLADETPVSGHSGAIAEWLLTLHFITGKSATLQASVHRYEMEHAFLEENTYRKTKNGNFIIESNGMCRLRGLGKWMFDHAPQGKIGGELNSQRTQRTGPLINSFEIAESYHRVFQTSYICN